MLIFKYGHTASDGWTREDGQEVYALLHDLDGNAMDFSAVGTKTLAIFDGDNDRFGLTLTEDALRTGFFQTQVSSGTFILADSDFGKPYSVEYWATESVSGVKDRASDTLLKLDEYPWAGGYNENPVLINIYNKTTNLPDAPAGSRYETFVSFTYDSDTQRLGYMCWLEKDGEFVTGATNCTLTVVDSSGDEVFSDAVPAAVGTDAIAGSFVGEQLSLALYADDNFFATCTILDETLVARTSASSPVTWD